MGGRPGLIAGLVGFVVVVAGCSSGAPAAAPDVGPPATGTSSAAVASPPPTGPATLDGLARRRVPTAARAHTPQGAEAFARFYLQQVNKAWTTPDPELIRPYALPSCKTCANYVGSAEWLKAHAAHYDVDALGLGPAVVAPESTTSLVIIEMGANQAAANIVDTHGQISERVTFHHAGAQVHVRWRNGSWLIDEIKVMV